MAYSSSGDRWRTCLSVVWRISLPFSFYGASFSPRSWDLRSLGTILDFAKPVPERVLCGFGDRGGQCDRKPRGICRAVCGRSDWAENWKPQWRNDSCWDCFVGVGKFSFTAPQDATHLSWRVCATKR